MELILDKLLELLIRIQYQLMVYECVRIKRYLYFIFHNIFVMSKGQIKTPLPPAQGKLFNAAQYVRPGLSEQEVIDIKAAFDLFDSDQGGSVDTKELKAAMVSLGFDSKNAVIFKMIAKLDEDGSGQLEFPEWLHLMTYKVSPNSTKDALSKIFPLYDDEDTGYITVENLARVAADLELSVPQEELEQMIDRADTDRDGRVSLQEFYTILTRPVRQ